MLKGLLRDSKVSIIAEAGVNHNGDINKAFRLIDMAVECGADAVKFQTFKAHEAVGIFSEKAQYQKDNMPQQESQYEMAHKLELPFEAFSQLKEYCDKKSIMFVSTPDGTESLGYLIKIGVPLLKAGSTEVTNHEFLAEMGRTGKQIILSTGMSTLGEVENALNAIYKTGNTDIVLLHCTTDYPTKIHEVNLRAMVTMREAFKLPVGLSDHTLSNEAAIAAVALGAVCIEKHITLDRNLEGPDHKASMPPDEFKKYVESIRNTEKLLGNGIKQPTESEKNIMDDVRRSIVASRDIKIGMIITRDMLAFKRPGSGIRPEMVSLLLGRTIKRDILADEPIRWNDI